MNLSRIILKTCHNCGFPSDQGTVKGRSVVLHLKAANSFRKPTNRTVGAASDACAYQALAIAEYGPASHRWPITLAEFRSLNLLPRKKNEKRCHPTMHPSNFQQKPQERKERAF
jgi:hypothetical protein